MKRIVATWVVFLLANVCVYADGKFYWREKVPPDVPYQRALLLFDGDTETLILQSKYSVAKQGGQGEMGWVIPVPAVPDLASMPRDNAFFVFWQLGRVTSPDVIQVSKVLIRSILVASLLFPILCCVPKFRRWPWVIANRRMLRDACFPIILFWVLMGLVGPGSWIAGTKLIY